MSEILWTKSLLEECRNEKGVVLGMMSEEARWAIISNKLNVQRYSMEGFWKCGNWRVDELNSAYRLSPYYTPPELAPKPYVDCPVELARGGEYVFIRSDGMRLELSYAIDFADFAGYVYANGHVGAINCRLPSGKEGPFSAPVAVRFWIGGDK